MNLRKLLITTAIQFAVGCTMIPRYEQPPLPVQQTWPNDDVYAEETDEGQGVGQVPAAEIGWQDFLQDPRLQQIVSLALTNNRDLRIALLNIEQAQAFYRIQRSNLVPGVGATASQSRDRRYVSSSSGNEVSDAPTTEYRLEAAVSYEVDLFGRLRSLKRSAFEQYLATEDAARSAHISLVAQVATQYLLERALDEQLALARQTLTTVEESYELISRSFALGHVSQLDLSSAGAQVQTARVNEAAYEEQVAQARNLLVLLVGQPLPADLPSPKPLADQHLMADLDAGIPSDLLIRRPDISAAEHALKSANADIGAARAAFFPSIELTASGGVASAHFSDLFSGSSGIWSFGPRISIPLFSGGLASANLDRVHILKQIEAANYERTIQAAFREVSDALVSRKMVEKRIHAQTALAKAERERFVLSDARYKHGIDSYLNVLTAQRDLYEAEQRLIQIRFDQLTNLVTFYRALGGGWKERSQGEHAP